MSRFWENRRKGKSVLSAPWKMFLIIGLWSFFQPCLLPAQDMNKSNQKKDEGYQIETITVTANKVEEDITDVPQSISVIDDEVLKEKGIVDIPGVIIEIPNMSSKYHGSTEQVNFRGLNYSYFTNTNPVVFYIDGVASSSAYGFNASLVNAERVEVLRGPQGTLYGKDAIGAVIKVVTKEPENQWHGSVGAEYGSYNYMQGSFNVNGPLMQDKLYLGLNGRYQQDDGWITNDYTGNDEYNKDDQYNLGGYLLYTPTDRFTAKFTLSNDSSERHGFDGYGLPDAVDISEFSRDDAEHVFIDVGRLNETDSLAQSLHLKYEFDSMTLTSATTHKDLETENFSDADRIAGTDSDGLIYFGALDIETWSEELRLSSNNTEGVRWVAGVYFDTEDTDTGPYGYQFYSYGSAYEMNYESKAESKTQALFGQTMIPFLDNFELTLGLRYQHIDKEIDLDTYYNLVGSSSDPYYALQADKTWDTFLGKIALSYRLNDNWNTYASVAQGYMPGGFNYSAGSGSVEDNTFDPQQSINYEIGVKGEFNRARLSAALFYMEIEDIHVYTSENDIWRTDNADSAHSLGAELELTYFLTDSIELTAAIGIIDSEYDDYDTGTVVYDGESISDTPSHTMRIGAAYFNPNGFYARGDVLSMGEIPYYDSANKKFSERDSYITADVKVGYRFKGFDIYAYCNNLTDEEYFTSYNPGSAGSSVTFGDPRTFGIGVRYSF
ncbi:TonB-dependent receptor [uncultured Desulfobacter sp.]|uniref:TonB-dependent receptor n=1 Tax=uncultured Desulfobacter sp. TaxID=240139 RepID=UPI002AA69ADA|nr:TonB-dependent receptor [uncultured Desulfobacter sp.]